MLCYVPAELAKQVEHALLGGIRLGQSRDTGLIQNREPGEVRDFGRDVRCADTVFRAGQVLHLVVDNVDGGLQAVDACADCTADAGDVGDGAVDVAKRSLGGDASGVSQRVAGDVHRVCTSAIRDGIGSNRADGDADLARRARIGLPAHPAHHQPDRRPAAQPVALPAREREPGLCCHYLPMN